MVEELLDRGERGKGWGWANRGESGRGWVLAEVLPTEASPGVALEAPDSAVNSVNIITVIITIIIILVIIITTIIIIIIIIVVVIIPVMMMIVIINSNSDNVTLWVCHPMGIDFAFS